MIRIYFLTIVWFSLCLVTGLGVAEVCSLFMANNYADRAGFVCAVFLGVLGAVYGEWW